MEYSPTEIKILQELGYRIEQPKPEQVKNLLARALDYQTKNQWHTGEKVTLWQGTRQGKQVKVYLSAENDQVNMYMTGKPHYLTVFTLGSNGWLPIKDIEYKYNFWVTQVTR